MVGNGARQVAAWNFFVNLAANDYLQLLISPGTSTGSEILAAAAGTNPTRPEIPSVILTVNQIGWQRYPLWAGRKDFEESVLMRRWC